MPQINEVGNVKSRFYLLPLSALNPMHVYPGGAECLFLAPQADAGTLSLAG